MSGKITIIRRVSASEQAIPPLVIFNSKSINYEGEVSGTAYSDKGWVNSALFREWMEHFLQFAVAPTAASVRWSQ